MKTFTWSICMLIVAVLSGGCQRPFTIKIDSLASPEAYAARTYVLDTKEIDPSLDPLQVQEYTDQLNRALSLEGFTKASDIARAEIVIIVKTQISQPQSHMYSYEEAEYGQTGISSSTTHGHVKAHGNKASYTETTTYEPSYGITGYHTVQGTYTTCTRELKLTAIDTKSHAGGEKQKPLWTLSVVSEGTCGSLRTVFPYLVTAAKPYFAKTVDGEIKLKTADKRVTEIRGNDSQKPSSSTLSAGQNEEILLKLSIPS